MDPLLFAYYFAWPPDGQQSTEGYSTYATRPTFEQRHGIPYLVRSDPQDESEPTLDAYRAAVQDLRDYEIDVVIVFAKDSMADEFHFVWTDLDEQYWRRVLAGFAENSMPFVVAVPPRWFDTRWAGDGLLGQENYIKGIQDCAARIDDFVAHIYDIESTDSAIRDSHYQHDGQPAFFVNAANAPPCQYPELFWTEVARIREQPCSLWGMPHAWNNGGGVQIWPCEHGFSPMAWYSGFEWTPAQWWRDLRTERANVIDKHGFQSNGVGERIRKVARDLLNHYGTENVILPVSFGFDKYRATIRAGGHIIPPIYERLQDQMLEFYTGLFSENDITAFSVIWNEHFEGEAVEPQVEYSFREALMDLRRRLAPKPPTPL